MTGLASLPLILGRSDQGKLPTAEVFKLAERDINMPEQKGSRSGVSATALKFPLGQILCTPGVLEALGRTSQRPIEFIRRHAVGDWGELDEEDRAENERSLKDDCRLLSAYRLQDGTKIWIITEADRSATTLLLPEEY